MSTKQRLTSDTAFVLPDDWAIRCVAAMETDSSIGRRAIMVQRAIDAFANDMARRFPPSSSLYVLWRPPRTPGLGEMKILRLPATVCRVQVCPNELPGFGLLVHLDAEMDGKIDASRLRTINDVGNVYVFHFYEIDEEATRRGICAKCGAVLSTSDTACLCRPCSRPDSITHPNE